MELWFENVKPWSGEPTGTKRFVWLKCQGIPLNAWCAQTFKQIGEIWGHFISVDDDTLKEKSYAKGMVLIAMEETQRINRWINIVIQGTKYEVRIFEDVSFVSPNEVESSLLVMVGSCGNNFNLDQTFASLVLQTRNEKGAEDVEGAVEKVAANKKKVVGGSVAGLAGMHGADKGFDGGMGAKHSRGV